MIALYENISGFEIPVNHTNRMDEVERQEELGAHWPQLSLWERQGPLLLAVCKEVAAPALLKEEV
jgi:hypothetical protein